MSLPELNIMGRPDDVLSEAYELIRGPRKEHYGPPEENLARIAALWTAYFDIPVTAHDVCSAMILLKQARGRSGYNRDNSVDTAGYAGLQEVLHDAQPQRGTVGGCQEDGGCACS